MAFTPNYNLYVEGDANVKFLDWRNQMNGPTESNMHKIDAALTGKAGKSLAFMYTLNAAGWSGSNAPYTMTLSDVHFQSNENGVVSVSNSATHEQREAARNACLSVGDVSGGNMVVIADGEKPTVNIPIDIVIIG